MEVVALDHPRFTHAWADVFTRRVVADCMNHHCAIVATHTTKLDACCQYGADVDLFERDAILRRADDIRAILNPEAKTARWFDDDEETPDPDSPSGLLVRTAVLGSGCLFLAHDGRGCAIHRASIERGWDMNGTKPHVCRLFPLSYETHTILISDDYVDYSCAYDPDAPSVYRVGRSALAQIFGEALVVAMDAAEAKVLARRLPVVA
jgi:Fe-S-cluster containining protein